VEVDDSLVNEKLKCGIEGWLKCAVRCVSSAIKNRKGAFKFPNYIGETAKSSLQLRAARKSEARRRTKGAEFI